jgi:hypothetical protein
MGTDDLAVVNRIETQVGLEDGLLDVAQDGGVPGLHREEPGLRGGQGGHLGQGHAGAVAVHLDALQQGHGGPAGPHPGEIPGHDLQHLVHLAPGFR